VALRDVTLAQVQEAEGKLSPIVFKRCRMSSRRSRERRPPRESSRAVLRRGGELMCKAISLRDDYQVSIPELDSWSIRR